MTLQDKLRIITNLFQPYIVNPHTKANFDYEFDSGFTRAYSISIRKDITLVTKSDLIYINTICNDLIQILKLNKANIDQQYVHQKLNHSVTTQWIEAYKELIDNITLT